MVMGDLAADVMEDVGLGDSVGSMGTNPSHDASAVTEQVSVKGGKSTTSESELGGTVMREEGVGVLQEGDQHKPVVNPTSCRVSRCILPAMLSYSPEVGKDVDNEDGGETPVADASNETSSPKEDTDVGDHDLVAVMGREHRGGGVEV